MRRGATISGITLRLEGRPSISYDIDPSGTLLGRYQQTGAPAYARMARIPPAALSGPEAVLDWAEPERLFLEGPQENGAAPARLETVLFRPAGRGPGPFPLLVFHHGSTGNGDDPAIFSWTYWNYAIAEYFTARGWLVAFPQRRGRGRSEGLYDEGFAPDRAQGYSCDPAISLRGADRALADAEAAVAALRRRTDVAPGPILTGGISRGGVLAIAFAGRHPDQVAGVLNFVGGWIGTGCGTAEEINGPLFRGGGRYRRPTLWIYGNGDGYYPPDHSRANFELFRQEGGTGRFLVLDVPGGEGHAVAAYRELWLEPVGSYLAAIEKASPR
jgi:dienelactone hydrolase